MNGSRVALCLFVLPAVAAALAPGILVYDRAAIFAGEWWRLFTGHWVHFSVSHAAGNLATLTLATCWLERARPGWTARYVFVAAPLLGLGLLAVAPAMRVYGGLSGLLAGVVVLLALAQITIARHGRFWWFALLALLAGKIVGESATAVTLFSQLDPESYRPSAAAHVLGTLIALGGFLTKLCGRARGQSVAQTALSGPGWQSGAWGKSRLT